MGYSKLQFVNAAFAEIGLASYVWNLTPEEQQSASQRLDAMMASWAGKNINLGFPLPTQPENSDLNSETNVPNWANQAIITNLAVLLAPQYGKAVAQETTRMAREEYRNVMNKTVQVLEVQFPSTLPIGQGNKRIFLPAPFSNAPNTSPLQNTDNNELQLWAQ